MNYNETYFELNSEETTHCHVICVYIKGHVKIVGHVEIADTKDQSKAIVYGTFFVDTVDTKMKACNSLNAMFVKTVNTGVCSSYTTLYTEYCEV